MRIVCLGILVLALAAASQAQAQQPRHNRGASLFISPMGEVFRGDADHTGLQLWFAEADADHDGRVSLAEFIANADANFPHIDANGDGAVTSLESTAFWQANAPEVINPMAEFETPIESDAPPTDTPRHSEHHDSSDGLYDENSDPAVGSVIEHSRPRSSQDGPRGEGAQRFGLLGDAEPIMSCDNNFDRRITKAEFDQCAARRFVALDANRDGYFTLDEAHPWLTQAHAER